MLRLPGLRCPPAAAGPPAQLRHDGDAHHDRARLSRARPVLEILRCRSAAGAGAGARHGRAPRRLRPRLHREVLRGPGLSRPCQLLGQFHQGASALRRRAAARLALHQSLLQHRHLGGERHLPRRSLVAARRLRAVPGHDRSRLRLDGLSRRHRRHQCLEPHGYPCPGLSGPQRIFTSDRLPHDTRFRSQADPRDSLPPAHLRADPQFHGVSRLLAARPSSTTTAPSTSITPAAKASSRPTSRRCASSRCSGPMPRR